MDERRREIIVREIEYWKRSRLLPEKYCNYLLALYTEGDDKKRPHNRVSGRRRTVFTILLAGIICLLLPASALVIYFTELSFVLQMLLFALFFLICLIAIWRWKERRNMLHIPLISGAWIFLLSTIEVSEYYFPKQKAITALTVFANCLLWIFMGKRFHLLYFLLSGIIGTGILIVFLLR